MTSKANLLTLFTNFACVTAWTRTIVQGAGTSKRDAYTVIQTQISRTLINLWKQNKTRRGYEKEKHPWWNCINSLKWLKWFQFWKLTKCLNLSTDLFLVGIIGTLNSNFAGKKMGRCNNFTFFLKVVFL